MNCTYCNEPITNAEDKRLNQRLIDVLGDDANPYHMTTDLDCASKSEIDDYAQAAPNMRGYV